MNKVIEYCGRKYFVELIKLEDGEFIVKVNGRDMELDSILINAHKDEKGQIKGSAFVDLATYAVDFYQDDIEWDISMEYEEPEILFTPGEYEKFELRIKYFSSRILEDEVSEITRLKRLPHEVLSEMVHKSEEIARKINQILESELDKAIEEFLKRIIIIEEENDENDCIFLSHAQNE